MLDSVLMTVNNLFKKTSLAAYIDKNRLAALPKLGQVVDLNARVMKRHDPEFPGHTIRILNNVLTYTDGSNDIYLTVDDIDLRSDRDWERLFQSKKFDLKLISCMMLSTAYVGIDEFPLDDYYACMELIGGSSNKMIQIRIGNKNICVGKQGIVGIWPVV